MNSFRVTILISFLVCILSVAMAFAGSRLVMVGVYENKPLVFRDVDGGDQGITIDILNEVAQRKDWQITYVPGTWAENLSRLSKGEIDLLVAIAWSQARTAMYQFNDKTVLSNWGQLYSIPKSRLDSMLSLNGKTVALVEKDIYSLAFVDLVKKFNLKVTLLPVNRYADALQSVVTGSADAALVSRLFGQQAARQYKLAKTPIVFNPIEIRFAAPLDKNGDLLRTIDVVLTELEDNDNSIYHQSIDYWLSGKKQIFSSTWIWKILQGVSFFLLVAICFIFYSRSQVRGKTTELQILFDKEKRLRHALQDSENKFRLSFKTSPDSININKLDGTYVEINDGFQEITGYTSEEVIGKSSAELNVWKNPSEREKLRAALEEKGSITNLEAEFVHKDGSIIPGLMSANIIEIDNEPHILSVTRNISTLKEQQRWLQRAEELWRQTFDAMQDIITVHDADMSILQANRAAREYYGSDTIEGQVCFQMVHGFSTPCVDCVVSKTFADGRPHSERLQHDKKDNTFIVTSHPIVSRDGTVKQVVQVAKDITESVAKEQERNLLARAIDQSTDTIVITNASGVIRYANPAFEEHSGYSRAEALGKNPRVLQSGQHNQAFYRELWHTILSGRTWQGKFINKKKNGELYHEKSTISPVRDNNGRIINFIAVKQNVTHERELEQQLQQAQKLESIGTLAGGIAHDFNNILGAILGYAQMAERQLPESSPVREDIAEIVVAGHRAVELVKQILAFSRQENEEFKPIKIQNIVQETLKLLKASLPATIQLEQMIETSCKPILGDPTQLHQVLLNLCTNAKHALGEFKGSISVSLKQRENGSFRGRDMAGEMLETGYLDIKVTDSGCGMDRQTMERIFDPFFTTKAKGQGTGLGLAVSYGIIKQHGGKIKVESTPGEGTTFVISLPTVESEVDWASGVALEEPLLGSEHIVLVDDEKNLVDIVERMLVSLGYTVTSFSESQRALAWMQENLTDFDLLLTDMTMPVVTGADLTEKLLALRPELPIILCTGFSETLNKEQAIALGIREYLLKPVTKQQLAGKLHKVLHP